MDMNKMLQWMDLAKKYQNTDFWNEILGQSSFEEFMKNNSDFRQADNSSLGPRQAKTFPPTDIYITDQEVMLISDLAGYAKENIQLSLSGTKLLIKGNNNQINKGELVQKERYQGDFERVIQLPEPTYPNQIRARFHNGLLIVAYQRQFRNEEQVPIE